MRALRESIAALNTDDKLGQSVKKIPLICGALFSVISHALDCFSDFLVGKHIIT